MASCMGCLFGCVFILAALLQASLGSTVPPSNFSHNIWTANRTFKIGNWTVHVVGNSLGWTVPPSNFSYDAWAANQTFMVGDKLLFNFTNGTQDVGEFSKADYESCNVSVSNSIDSVVTGIGTAAYYNIGTAGEHYYTSTIGDHCQKNQKLAITTYGTHSSDASSLTIGGFSLLLLPTIMAFFY
ncbi:cucumber peeling cupredoxin-like [Macadamia integrifolia]|uniref:cucumber peeling cupredoxin-like n=1 Tax=Macadamia integrifolia TaxID=60698 RepID=UPI001C4FE2B8|nr:cucumber peeling cupredoxin-like [Macadamia integrifolia]XP_042513944.1 cucumber peeling cupredoxin-like [Macadamia integrifolia]